MTNAILSPARTGGFSLSDIQRHLGVPADGKLGPVTLTAISHALGMEHRPYTMQDPKAFFDGVRQVTGRLDDTQVRAINELLEYANHWPTSWLAYGLATGWHEARLRPISEQGGNVYFHDMYDIQGKRPRKAAELGNTNPGDGIKYHGRGLPQLTGRTNYRNAGEALGLDLEGSPDLVLDPQIAVEVMVWGMDTGAFTGRSLSDCLHKDLEDHRAFKSARCIINGTDKADLIAEYAVDFQQAIWAGKWTNA